MAVDVRRGQKLKISVRAKGWSKEGAADAQHWTHANCVAMFFGAGPGGGSVKGTPVQMREENQQLSWTVTIPADAPAGEGKVGIYYCSASGAHTDASTNVLGPQKGVQKDFNVKG